MDLMAALDRQLPSFHIDVFRGRLTATAKGFFTTDNPAPPAPRNARMLIDAFNEAFDDRDAEATEDAARNLSRRDSAARFPVVFCTGDGARCFFPFGDSIYAETLTPDGEPDFNGEDANPMDALDAVWLSATTELGVRFLISVARTFGPESHHARLIQQRVSELIWEDLPDYGGTVGEESRAAGDE